MNARGTVGTRGRQGDRRARRAQGDDDAQERRDRLVSIAEAVLLSIVALMAAWSGYAAAKWSTESRVGLAEASTARTQGKPGESSSDRASELRLLDLRGVVRRLHRPQQAGDGPRGASLPARLPGRVRRLARDEARDESQCASGPDLHAAVPTAGDRKGRALDTQADEAFASGASAGETSDKYVRTTVFLASVLFLVGISTRFPLRGVRYALVALGAVLLVVSFVQLTQLPGPPT